MPFKTDLPIAPALPGLRRALSEGRSAVLEAPAGAGKTTIVPLDLLDAEWLGGRRIVMLEPRRLAARAAAARMAELLGSEVGGTAGYRTRMDTRVGRATRIEVVTEGVLTRMLQNDPSLAGVGLVIFDEFHERSLQGDLGLALALESREVFSPGLRILVMSATLDGREVSALLGGAPVVKSEGRSYPVQVRYLPRPARPGRDRTDGRYDGPLGKGFVPMVVRAVHKVLAEETGSVLVFLPGAGEIRRAGAALREGGLPEGVEVAPLYGNLTRDAQDRAIRPAPPGRRKVVLATSIAETSLTIEGVRVVIDGGLQRRPRFSPSTGMSRLETTRVTRDSAQQRRGRAGRVEPGVCLRLWTEGEDGGLREKATPEILEADLTGLTLELAIWGVSDAGELKWIDPPPAPALGHARELLARLGAVDGRGAATAHGRAMAALPLHPRLAHMVLKGRELGLGTLACHLASLLAERDILRLPPDRRDPDIRHRLDVVAGGRGGRVRLAAGVDVDGTLAARVRAVARDLARRLTVADTRVDPDDAGPLLALAYPDRIGKRREGRTSSYLLANGRGARLPGPAPSPEFSRDEYIVAASLDGGGAESTIFLASPLGASDLERLYGGEMAAVDTVEWNEARGGVEATRRRCLWSIVVSQALLPDPDPDLVLSAFLEGVRGAGLRALPWDRETENLRARIGFLARLKRGGADLPDLPDMPDLSDGWLLSNLDEWLAPWVVGMTRLEHLRRLDLKGALLALLDWPRREALDTLAPTHLTVPSGSRLPLDYASGDRPVLAVRLQEMFGLATTPAVAGGRVPVLLHLLSPAGRPVQVTDDLAGFWARGYEAVRKEMKGRYPKHCWPDDPMEAEPTSRAGRRRSK